MPFEIVSQHAKEHVRAHSIRQPVIDRPDLQIDGFEAAKGPLHQRKGFVAAYGCRIVAGLSG